MRCGGAARAAHLSLHDGRLSAATVPALDARVGLWNVLRKQDALQAVSSGPARLYFTPNDVNLSIETKESDNVFGSE